MTDDRPASDAEGPTARTHVSRRALLLGAGAAAGLAIGAGGATLALRAGAGNQATDAAASASGPTQAGVARPTTPQRTCIVAVGTCDLSRLRDTLAALGEMILTVSGRTELLPDGPGDLTVTVGLGAAALEATAHPALAEIVAMPAFAGDEALGKGRSGGDLLLSVNASDPLVLEPVLAALTEVIAGWQVSWSDLGFRGASEDGVARNPLGYFDGIVGPKTEAELAAAVWIDDGPLAGGSVCVIRRFRLDTAAFRALGQAERDAVVGRRQQDGAPLSGGARDDDVDLLAKTATGEFVLPPRAHARAAHPSFTGSGLMLRRSYSYRASDTDHGHLFICFQNDVQTFVKTQLRLDETDDLMAFSTPTATGAFAVLPGFGTDRPLGAALF